MSRLRLYELDTQEAAALEIARVGAAGIWLKSKELWYVGELNGAGHPRVVFFGLDAASGAAASDGRLSGRRADAAFEL